MGGYVGFLKGCNFEHTKLSIHFESFNYEYEIVKEAKDANLLSQESKLTNVNLQLNFMSFTIDHPSLKTDTFQYLKVNLQPCIFTDTLQAGQTMLCNKITFSGFVK